MTVPPPARPPNTEQGRDAESLDGGTSRSVDHTPERSSSRPHLPNDRDESVGMTTGGVTSSPEIEQARRDVERGLQDTSRANETNDAYEKLKQ